ncbi:ABC transporter permease [Candidatus Micrarchaeota archaeon]|nr:ABC transporter permease [Candidatus Micrarchaeota archaeon]
MGQEKIADFLALAFQSLTHRRLRSFLTIVGIFIGIATVVALLALGQGLQDTIQGEFNKLGADKITVLGYNGLAATPFVSATTAKPISETDRKAIERIRGVDVAGGILYKSVGTSFKRETLSAFAIGVPTDGSQDVFEETQFGNLLEGRHLRDGDKNKVVIGFRVHDGAFARLVNLGDTLEVDGTAMQVVGVYDTLGNDIDDNSIYLPLDAMREQFDEPELLSMILVRVQDGTAINDVALRIEDKLRKLKNQDVGEETFSVSTPEQLTEQFNTVFGVVTFVLVGIAAISLVVGGIGIMNTMYTAILERTKEIGILKAVGAKNADIATLFLMESGMLGLVGGVAGVILGAGLSKIAEVAIQQAAFSNFHASLGLELVAGALAFSFVVGGLSGLMPARAAATLNPVDALRYE